MRAAAGLLVCCCLCVAPRAASALDPALPPGGNFDLSHWKLTLPVDARGAMRGDASEIRSAALRAGYQDAWFRTGEDGAMVFRTPAAGATTEGSDYARTELRELLAPDHDELNWPLQGHARLAARLAVARAPAGGKLVVGQIHAFEGPPLLKLRYHDRGMRGVRLDALLNRRPGDARPASFPLAAPRPGKAFGYTIAVDDGVLTVGADGGTPLHLTIDPAWSRYRFYFKAGLYLQARGAAADGGELRFYALRATHAP